MKLTQPRLFFLLLFFFFSFLSPPSPPFLLPASRKKRKTDSRPADRPTQPRTEITEEEVGFSLACRANPRLSSQPHPSPPTPQPVLRNSVTDQGLVVLIPRRQHFRIHCNVFIFLLFFTFSFPPFLLLLSAAGIQSLILPAVRFIQWLQSLQSSISFLVLFDFGCMRVTYFQKRPPSVQQLTNVCVGASIIDAQSVAITSLVTISSAAWDCQCHRPSHRICTQSKPRSMRLLSSPSAVDQ